MKIMKYILLIATLMIVGVGRISAQNPDPVPDLTTATLEDLMNIEVTSVSKKEEKLFQSASAVRAARSGAPMLSTASSISSPSIPRTRRAG